MTPNHWLKLILALCVFPLLLACAQTQAATLPTRTPTPRPTPTLIPTYTPSPTVTPQPSPSPLPSACPRPDLGPGSHLAASGSYTETQTTAAGPMVCRIERNSCAYYQLVGNLEPSIIFKREETSPYNEEDILMHPAMLLPLHRLNEMVHQEWDGEVQLRVTDSYDSLLEHDLDQLDENRKVSLHFEGRAIDLTTWPIDPARYGRLCVLAHCAGFNWVHNEGTHCHAAIRAESLCFSCSN